MEVFSYVQWYGHTRFNESTSVDIHQQILCSIIDRCHFTIQSGMVGILIVVWPNHKPLKPLIHTFSLCPWLNHAFVCTKGVDRVAANVRTSDFSSFGSRHNGKAYSYLYAVISDTSYTMKSDETRRAPFFNSNSMELTWIFACMDISIFIFLQLQLQVVFVIHFKLFTYRRKLCPKRNFPR